MTNKFLCCLFLFILLPVSASGDYSFVHYDKTNHGLAYNGIRAIITDRQGFTWIATYKGLSRFDGKRFKIYDKQDFGVPSDYISSIAEDSRGNIWIGTDNGIIIYERAADKFVTLAEWSGTLGVNDRIFSIVAESNDSMLIGTNKSGLYRCDLKNHSMRPVDLFYPNGNEVMNIYRMVPGPDNKLYICVYCDNIYIKDRDSNTLAPVTADVEFFKNDDIEGLVLADTDKRHPDIYVASKRHGLCRITSSDEIIRVIALAPGERPTGLSGDGEYLWMSTTAGLWRYQPSTNESLLLHNEPDDRFSLSENYVTTAYKDQFGRLWAGTQNSGINVFNKDLDLFHKYHITSDGMSLDKCMVRGFDEDEKGVIWIATANKGLLYLTPEGKLLSYKPEILPKNITALCTDGSQLFVGTQNGILAIKHDTGAIQMHSLPRKSHASDNRIVSLFKSSTGDIYAGTALGVLKYDPKGEIFRSIDSMDNLTIEHMSENAKGEIWMASYSDGVFRYDPHSGKLTHYHSRGNNPEMPHMTSSICIAGDKVWVLSFSSGLMLFNSKTETFSNIDKTKQKLFPSDIFFSGVPDDKGNLWISSASGLMKYNPENNYVNVFRQSEGLLDEGFNRCALKCRNGNIIFGSDNGFIIFNPHDFKTSADIGIAISDFEIGGKSAIAERFPGNIDLSDEIQLYPNENSFGFIFSTPASLSSSYGKILCCLEGYDEGWIDISSDLESKYYNVPPGTYTLKLKTITDDGIEKIIHKPLKITVEPKFLESSLGISFLIILILLMASTVAFLLYRRAVRIQKKRQEEQERMRIAETYEEKITFFSGIAHEIKTPLTLIKDPLHQIMQSTRLTGSCAKDLQVISDNTRYMDTLVKELLDFVRVERHGYNLVLTEFDLIEKIEFIISSFSETAKSKNVKIIANLPADISFIVNGDEGAVTKIINNILHNAVKYAENEIVVTAHGENNEVIIEVSNDGPTIPEERRATIFDPFTSYGDTGKSQGFGIGLSLARTFAEMHGGHLILAPDNGKTVFVCTLPCHIRHSGEIRKTAQTDVDDYLNSSVAPLIVLAEDNDDLRRYLTRKLKELYRVIAVASAEEALTALKSYQVDILITDIVMKSMTGLELCRMVTSDIETSHVPVILVSGLSSDSTKIESMNCGATLFIEKPFALDYLLSCIRNILDKRKAMKNSIARNEFSTTSTSDYPIPDIDNEFIAQLDSVVTQNLGDSEFSARQLEETLFVSHSTLNRKIKALFGTTPNGYIRSRRLALAARMLKEGNMRINEICRAVGMPSPSYFSKCFKDNFGVLPQEYRSQTD